MEELLPIDYTKIKFLKYLTDNNVSDIIVDKFNKLPEKITNKNVEYKINIISIFHSIGKTYYTFELNYYCDELNEFLFTYKIFNDIEKSIDYLLMELVNNKFIEK